jgi:very-short-patch-repair endonuclease
MELDQWLRERGGLARTRDARDAGFSRHALSTVPDLRRPRRGWVALPYADPMLVRAVVSGVVLTCVTQAERLGLWTYREDDRPHVAAPAHSGSVVVRDARVHWSRPLIPRIPGRLVDPIENVLATVAECQPHERALAIWDSAFRKGLVARDSFGRYDLRPAARRLLSEATPFLDSGLETFVLSRLQWLPVSVHPQVVLLGRRVDFLIGERLVLQIDGGHHVDAQREQDNAHDALLRLHGYTVVRVGYHQVTERWPDVQDLLLRAIAQGLHRA